MLSQAVCPSCGAGNRLDGRKDVERAKCGACHAPLQLADAIDVDDTGLERHLRMTKGPVVVDVWAPWCGPCRLMAPNFKAAAADLAGEARFLKLNADESERAGKLNIRGIPALLLFENEREIARQAGLMTREGIAAWASAHMKE